MSSAQDIPLLDTAKSNVIVRPLWWYFRWLADTQVAGLGHGGKRAQFAAKHIFAFHSFFEDKYM